LGSCRPVLRLLLHGRLGRARSPAHGHCSLHELLRLLIKHSLLILRLHKNCKLALTFLSGIGIFAYLFNTYPVGRQYLSDFSTTSFVSHLISAVQIRLAASAIFLGHHDEGLFVARRCRHCIHHLKILVD